MVKGQIVQVQLCSYKGFLYEQIAYVEYASGKIFSYPINSFYELPKTIIDFINSNSSVRVSETTYRMRGCLSHE